MKDDDRKALDAYLGKNIRRTEAQSSLLQSTSEWLNNGKARELVAIWLLRKNGPDFPVEADHTLGFATVVKDILPDEETEAMLEHERTINPQLDAWFKEGFLSTYTNEDFHQYAPGTVGGIISHQIKHHGFDITLGLNLDNFDTSRTLDFWRVRQRQMHDFQHIITGGQFNSLGEIAVTFGVASNQATHFSPDLARALNVYMTFAGLRMVTRSLLHYPETWPVALRCLEQGIYIGRVSPPFHFFRWEDVFDKTPDEARAHFGMPNVPEIDSHRESIIFREDPEDLAMAAE